MNKDLQLFILPYAGGSIASFKRLTDLISESVEVITVEYPGRGTRAKEPLANSIQDLLNDAIEYCRDRNLQFARGGGILQWQRRAAARRHYCNIHRKHAGRKLFCKGKYGGWKDCD